MEEKTRNSERIRLDNELQAIADIENAFKRLGKKIYSLWQDNAHEHSFETLMNNFDKTLTKLEAKK